MDRRSLTRAAGALALAATVTRARANEPRIHKLVLHVGSADPVQMGIALHNLANAAEAYAMANEAATIELVANGGGYTMLRADTSPVKAEIAELHKKYPAIRFSACQASRAGQAIAEKKKPEDIPQVPEATDVAFGIVRLTQLQENDFAYVRV